MTATKILQSVGLDPRENVFALSNASALDRILEFIKEWELKIQIAKISKTDWLSLFENYAESISTYHAENDHQERGAFLRSRQMLKKYGLTREDIARLDFC